MKSRKFRMWDSICIGTSYEDIMQIMASIEQLADEHKADPSQLPASIVPTDLLYNMAVGYEDMYNRLLELDLIDAGYTKQLSTIH